MPQEYHDRLHERLWSRIQKGDGCWEWSGARERQRGGYGVLTVFAPHRQKRRVSRLVWECVNGPIPDGMFVCHRCDNPPCARPDHLFLGTPQDNRRDCSAKGRARVPRGEQQRSSKLTADDVREIRTLTAEGATQAELAAHYGVTTATLYALLTGRTWSHIA